MKKILCFVILLAACGSQDGESTDKDISGTPRYELRYDETKSELQTLTRIEENEAPHRNLKLDKGSHVSLNGEVISNAEDDVFAKTFDCEYDKCPKQLDFLYHKFDGTELKETFYLAPRVELELTQQVLKVQRNAYNGAVGKLPLERVPADGGWKRSTIAVFSADESFSSEGKNQIFYGQVVENGIGEVFVEFTSYADIPNGEFFFRLRKRPENGYIESFFSPLSKIEIQKF